MEKIAIEYEKITIENEKNSWRSCLCLIGRPHTRDIWPNTVQLLYFALKRWTHAPSFSTKFAIWRRDFESSNKQPVLSSRMQRIVTCLQFGLTIAFKGFPLFCPFQEISFRRRQVSHRGKYRVAGQVQEQRVHNGERLDVVVGLGRG